MTRLLKIVTMGDGLKGAHVNQTLTGCDVLVGPNGSGKSRTLVAVLAGLHGLASTPTDKAREWIGPNRPKTKVRLEFDSGAAERDLDVIRGKRFAAANAAMEAVAGAHVIRWDLQDFLRDSDTSRAALIEKLCQAGGDAGGWDGQKLRKWLIDDLKLPESKVADHKMSSALWGGEPSDWISKAIDWIGTEYTKDNAASGLAKKTLEGMAAERSKATEVVGDLASARTAVAKAESEVTAAKTAIGTTEARGSERAAHEKENKRLLDAVGASENALENAKVGVTDAERSKRILGGNPVADSELTAAGSDVERLAQVGKDAAADLEAEQQAQREHLVLVGRAAGEVKAWMALDGAGLTCAHCGEPEPIDVSVQLDDADARMDELNKEHADFDGDVELAQKLLDLTRTQYVKATDVLSALEKKRADYLEAHDSVTLAIEEAGGRVKACEGAVETSGAQLTAFREQEVPDDGDAAPPEMLQATLETAEADLTTAKADGEQLTRQSEREAAFQRAQETRHSTEELFDQTKALKKSLLKLKSLLAEAAYGPISEHANEVLELAGETMVVSFRSASDFGIIKSLVDGRQVYVHMASISDGERATVGAAVAYAFTRLAQVPWRCLILDRLESVDEDRMSGLLFAMNSLQQDGLIDNFIGAATFKGERLKQFCEDEVPEGMTVVELGGAS